MNAAPVIAHSRPVQEFELPVHSVSSGCAADGLRILHLSDLHVRQAPSWDKRLGTLCAALERVRADVVVFTGDLMDHPGDEDAAIRAVRTILDALPPARALAPVGLRALAVLGNHDSVALDRSIESAVPGLRVLRNEAIDLQLRHGLDRQEHHRSGRDRPPPNPLPLGGGFEAVPSCTLRVLGWAWPEDPLGSMLKAVQSSCDTKGVSEHPLPEGGGRGWVGFGPHADVNPTSHEIAEPAAMFTLTLAHMPSMIFPAADLGLPLILCGHTHAGQIRVSPRLAPHTSSDVPVHLASGVLRLRSTLCCISRGLGDGVYPGLRFNCPWQAPLYTLRHGPLPAFPARGAEEPHTVQQVVAW